MEPMGFEPTTSWLQTRNPVVENGPDAIENADLRAPGGGRCTARCTNIPPEPLDVPNLQIIVTAWPTLPEAVRAKITAMVQAATEGGQV